MLPLSDIQCFCFIFPFCLFYIPFVPFIYSQTDFLHFATNEVASMSAILVQEWWFFLISGNRESLFVLNDLIYMLSIYIYIYIITFCQRGWSVNLIRLQQGSLSVGKNFGLTKTLIGNSVAWPEKGVSMDVDPVNKQGKQSGFPMRSCSERLRINVWGWP